MKTKNLCLVAAVMALSMVTGLLTSSGTAHAQLPTVPHYECYDLLPTGPLSPLPPMVTLETQFGVEEVQLGPMPARLCLPAIKNGHGSLEPSVPHVECLPIAGSSRNRIVDLETQFGTQTHVGVGPPIQMCMPANKAISPAMPSEQVPLVPHYECYAISGTAPVFPPVAIETQFGMHQGVVVGPPTRLCLPAIKNEEGELEDLEDVPHVECFQILANPPGPPPVLVNLWTQFGPQMPWVVGPALELCVPVLKEPVFLPIGGIAEAPDADASSLEATTSGGSSGTTYAAIAGIAAGVVLLGAGGWYARRRWLS